MVSEETELHSGGIDNDTQDNGTKDGDHDVSDSNKNTNADDNSKNDDMPRSIPGDPYAE